MPIIVGNSTVNSAITSTSVTENTPQGFAEYNATRNSVMPTLRLDFVNSNVLDPRITFTRASNATYFNSAGVLSTATTNTPRFDYNPSTGACNGLLMEQSSTNLLLQSTFQSGWSGGAAAGTLTANQLLSPDGTVNAAKFVETTAASAYHYKTQTITKAASALVYTFSVFLKASGNRQVTLRLSDGTNGAVVTCDPVAGTIATAGVYGTFTSASGTIQTIGNGWYRFSLTTTSSTATTILPGLESVSAGTNVYTGDGASGFYCFGAQLEQLAFNTSYIASGAGQGSRAVDQTSLTGTNFSSWYNSTNWTTIVSAIPSTVPNTSGATELLFQFTLDGSNRILSRIASAASVLTSYWINNISQPQNAGGYNSASLTANTLFKHGMTASNGSWNLALNGTIYNSTAGYLITPTSLSIGYGSNDFNGFNGWIQRFAYYPVVVSNNELISLTS